MGDILQIQVDLPGHDLLDIGAVGIVAGGEQIIFIAETDRRQPRDARAHQQHLPLVGGIQVHIVRHLRPGTHEAHVPHQHIDELGQLVYLTLAQKSAHRGNAAVIAGGDLQPRVILTHGAKLENTEGAIADLDKATSLKPEHAGAHELFGDALIKAGKEGEAALQWRIAEELRKKKS